MLKVWVGLGGCGEEVIEDLEIVLSSFPQQLSGSELLDSVPSLSTSSRKTSSLDPPQGGAGSWESSCTMNFFVYAAFDFGLCCTIGRC